MQEEKQKIFLYISDIAAYIGQNQYDFVTPFERLWKRCDTNNYKEIISLNKNSLINLQLELKNLEHEKILLDDDLNTKRITKRQYNLLVKNKDLEIKKEVEKIEELETKIDTIDLNQEERLTESFINKTHGTLKEDSAIKMFEKRFNVTLDTSQKFYKHRLKISDESKFDWYIGGKMDGIYKDQYIVEVKNRMRGFFNTLRDYEKTQIHIYMHLLQIPLSKLVEKYENNIRITTIYQNNDYLKDILEYLNVFITHFEKDFLNNT